MPRRFRSWSALSPGVVALLLGCGGVGTPRPRSAVLIVVDTLRPDHLGTYGSVRATSEELDRWAARGLVFERALAASSWTLPSMASILTGRWPATHGAGRPIERKVLSPNVSALDGELPTLPERLSAAGLRAGAIINNPFLHERFGVNRGFDDWDYRNADNRNLRRADVSVDRGLAWIDAREGEPFLLVLHLFDPHAEYDPPTQTARTFTGRFKEFALPAVTNEYRFLRRPEEREQEFVEAAYDEEVLFTVTQVARFLDGLEERGRLDDTLVLLTSDHGEEFWDHGGFEHGHTMYQELVHVPLIAWGPGIVEGREPMPVSHVDLLPTLLEAVGGSPDLPTDGLSLWPHLAGRVDSLPERVLLMQGTLYGEDRASVLRWPWKLIRTHGEKAPALYDLAADPAEARNLADEHPELVAEMLALLDVEPAPTVIDPSQVAPIEGELRERLRGLGYVK